MVRGDEDGVVGGVVYARFVVHFGVVGVLGQEGGDWGGTEDGAEGWGESLEGDGTVLGGHGQGRSVGRCVLVE